MNYVGYFAKYLKIEDFYTKLALIAHNCYQAISKTPDEIFIKNLIKNKHLAMCEHYHFHYLIDDELAKEFIYLNNPYIVLTKLENCYLLTCSIRPMIENYQEYPNIFYPLINSLPENIKNIFPVSESKKAKLIDLKDLPLETYFKVRGKHHFLSVMVVTDRGVTHELVRHRPCSFAQESTRYCNYSKNKFGHSVSFIKPLDYDKYHEIYDKAYQEAEDNYFAFLENGATPDIARAVLPNGIKTSIAVTASEDEWNHIYELRLDKAAHKDMRYTMTLIQHELKGEIL